jgi:hypothetical protein
MCKTTIVISTHDSIATSIYHEYSDSITALVAAANISRSTRCAMEEPVLSNRE